uniref:Uncharacterized protein n=1 Tax=Klebsiella pneumoniae TaxID=573 RepID=A0A8B0STQ6_KLEPN|nr:hypothetical protein [Klebsiella pneumoniae]
MDNRFSCSIICNYYAKSYLCIRVTITGSQKKLLFPSPRLQGSGFTGGGTHTLLGLRQRLLVMLTRKLLFLPTTCAQKIFKNANTLVSSEKNLLGFL